MDLAANEKSVHTDFYNRKSVLFSETEFFYFKYKPPECSINSLYLSFYRI